MSAPQRVVSLLDIMRYFFPALYLTLIRAMETLIQLEAGWNDRIKKGARDVFVEQAPGYCVDLGLVASKVTAEKIVKLLAEPDPSFEKFRGLVAELQERMIDEMKGNRFLALTAQEADYFYHPLKGWEEIVARFPDSNTDIEEAYKCFAASRYAAAVFHILQVIESGLIEFGKLIGVTDPLPGWTATTGKLAKIKSTKYPDRSQFEQENSAFFEQMHAAIEALQLAWRNKVSHVHGRLTLMTSEFHPEVAEEILVTSRALMRRLATGAPWPD